MVEFGNVNAYINHKTFLSECIGCCDDPQAFTLIDLIEISAQEGVPPGNILLINNQDKAVAIHSFK